MKPKASHKELASKTTGIPSLVDEGDENNEIFSKHRQMKKGNTFTLQINI